MKSTIYFLAHAIYSPDTFLTIARVCIPCSVCNIYATFYCTLYKQMRFDTCRNDTIIISIISIIMLCVPLSSQNSPFLQVLSSIAFPNSLLARLHGYLTIAGDGTSLKKFSLGSARRKIKLALLVLGHTII